MLSWAKDFAVGLLKRLFAGGINFSIPVYGEDGEETKDSIKNAANAIKKDLTGERILCKFLWVHVTKCPLPEKARQAGICASCPYNVPSSWREVDW